jgi:hypothetical protein
MYGNYEPGSVGHILNCLYKAGVPLRIVEELRIGKSDIYYYNALFATFVFTNNEPVFKFEPQFERYKLMGKSFKVDNGFGAVTSFTDEWQAITCWRTHIGDGHLNATLSVA